MKKKLFALIGLVLFCSHDMYLKMDTYFLEPNSNSIIQLYNGTFNKSENVIDRNRMLDVSLVGNGQRSKMSDDQWTEKDSTTILNFKTGETGTWVAGVSTAARNIELAAQDFNDYLEHDGVKDMHQWRKDNNALEEDAVEKYSKHVKAIFQVGDTKTKDYNTELGYPIEFVPLNNPYELHTGEDLEVKLLLNGQPLADQLVYADFAPSKHGHTHNDNKEHSHENDDDHSDNASGHSHGEESDHTHPHTDKEAEANHEHSDGDSSEGHTHATGKEIRTDSDGILKVNLAADGIWYLRTIHMVHNEEEGLTHESNWATLTFEVKHSHDEDSEHGHEHADEGGVPSYVFWIASIIIIGGLFFWFSRKK